MRAAQGVDDKQEARRETKVSTSGEYKGVDASVAPPVALNALRGVVVAGRCIVCLTRIYAASPSVEL